MKSIFCSSSGHKFSSWHPHTFTALLFLDGFRFPPQRHAIKRGLAFLVFSRHRLRTRTQSQSAPLPQLSQMPLITGSPQVVGLCRYTHTVSCASRHPVLMKHSARTEKEMLSNLFQDEREERLKTWEVLNDYSRFNFSPENSNSSTHGILSSFTGCYNALPT